MTRRIILLGGPGGAGKTTAAEAWARSRPAPTAHLNIDSVRRRLRSGLQQPHLTGWNKQTAWQYDLARDVAIAAAREYAGHGVDCIIDDGLLPGHATMRYERWAEAMSGVDHCVVVLLPDLATCLARNAQREPAKRLSAGLIRRFHDMSTRWLTTDFPIIDNSSLTLDETIAAIDAALDDS